MFVDHRRDLHRLAVDGRVELEVQCPHHIRSIRVDDRNRGQAGTFAAWSTPDLQPFFLPQAVDLLLVHLDALVVAQPCPRPTKPVPRMLAGISAQLCAQIGIRVAWCLRQRQPPVNRSGEPNDLAREPLRHLHSAGEHGDRGAFGGRAQNFPVDNENNPLVGRPDPEFSWPPKCLSQDPSTRPPAGHHTRQWSTRCP